MNLPRRRRWADEIRNGIAVAKDRQKALMIYDYGVKRQSPQSMALRSYWRRAQTLLRRVTQCPECRGGGTVPSILWAKEGNSYGYLTGARPQPIVAQARIVQENCPTCNGTGKL